MRGSEDSEEAHPVTVWQYAHLYYSASALVSASGIATQAAVLRELETLGRDGWELVSVAPLPGVDALAYYFKRPV